MCFVHCFLPDNAQPGGNRTITDANPSTAIPPERQLTVSVPVAIILEKRVISGKHWSENAWDLHSVPVGEHLGVNADGAVADGVKSGTTEQGELFLWGGYTLTLFRDACERYWHALIGNKPSVYVVLDEDEADGSISPLLVTLDYDEALAYGETDATVVSCEIPAELYQLMERFVLQNYQPAKFKKRKRKNWSEESEKAAVSNKNSEGSTESPSEARPANDFST